MLDPRIILALPSPGPTPSCVKVSDFCNEVYSLTGNTWLASGSFYFLVKPLRIALIVVLALIARHLLHRTIRRLVRSTSGNATPGILKPLRDRRPAPVRDSAEVVPERRRQRAEAIGSVLRSFSTALVSSIAVLLVLSEVGMDLAPLLASAGIAGVAIGFGAQSLVKDVLAGLFMLLEDQYGVGDTIDVGSASGVVEAVGLRITTIRDGQGVIWYIRNGEIVKVGNKSQGWSVVVVDLPVGFTNIDAAADVLRKAADGLGTDAAWRDDLIEPPEMLGVEQVNVGGVVLRTTVKTKPDARGRVGRELRRRLTDALAAAGITQS